MLTLRNPSKAGRKATIIFKPANGITLTIIADCANARRYLERNRGYVTDRCEQAAIAGVAHPMAQLFAECKARVEVNRAINRMGDAVWNR